VSESKLPTFHIDTQFAVALLSPIGSTLDEMNARLSQYAGRMPLSDTDRAVIARASEAISAAGETVHALIAERRTESRSRA
jgi:hypothetical protein